MNLTLQLQVALTVMTVDSTACCTYSSQFIWGGHNLSLEIVIAK